MYRMSMSKKSLMCVSLLAGGCGAFPEFLVNAGRDAAKEAMEKVIQDAVEKALSDVVGDFPGFSDELRSPDAVAEDGVGGELGR